MLKEFKKGKTMNSANTGVGQTDGSFHGSELQMDAFLHRLG